MNRVQRIFELKSLPEWLVLWILFRLPTQQHQSLTISCTILILKYCLFSPYLLSQIGQQQVLHCERLIGQRMACGKVIWNPMFTYVVWVPAFRKKSNSRTFSVGDCSQNCCHAPFTWSTQYVGCFPSCTLPTPMTTLPCCSIQSVL